jgi:hypothetical protein
MSDRLDMDFTHDLVNNATSDDYYTPAYIFEALNLNFDMDVCAPLGGIAWIPAKKSLSIIDDGLITDWEGLVWMNPPYSAPNDWIYKFVAHNNGLCLVPTSKANWFKFIWEKADGAMVMPPNLKFIKAEKVAQIQFQTIIFSMGRVATSALVASKLGRVR